MAGKKRTSMMPRSARDEAAAASTIASKILAVLSEVPSSSKRKHRHPAEASRKIANLAARRAAAAAGTLAVPPGPLGWLTLLPELVWVWKIQAQMVADIAACYGQKRTLTREQMLYCLFKHTASQALRDIVVQVGDRVIVRRTTVRALNAVAQRIGFKVTQRTLAKSASRWLPVVGAIGVAAYAYYDTAQVARLAMELYEKDIEVEPAASGSLTAAE
jgi:uncharacterized protein (DUF697 family)